MKVRFPSIEAVATALRDSFDRTMADGGTIDVRLQVHTETVRGPNLAVAGDWYLHWGDASYDTDHRGVWGSAEVTTATAGPDERTGNSGFSRWRDVARDLLEQARDMHAQSEDTCAP